MTGQSPTDIDHIEILAADLYKVLIEPLEPFLTKTDSLCIIPDKSLYHLPFAALFSAKQKKYLIENYALITAPSATVFLLCSKRAPLHRASIANRILAVGNPRFDQAVYMKLPDLTAAIREVNEIANNYTQSKVLTAEQAVEKTVRDEMKKASVIHLASHSIIDERSSANSLIVLSKPSDNNSGDGVLRAYEIAQMRLPARLAVLSACQSGVERFYRGEGMIGLSRAFLSAGVPTVVASLWAVDSEVTADLMISFHQQLKKYPASQALRQAQLALLRSVNLQKRHPYYWSSFSVFGGDVKL